LGGWAMRIGTRSERLAPWACGLLLLSVSLAAAQDLEMRAGPGAATPEEIAVLWGKATALEAEAFERDQTDPELARQRLGRAAALFERVGDEERGKTHGYWRSARATWIAGELLPLDAVTARIDAFNASLLMADRGLAANPDCAECMLWKFISMGRLRTTSGLFEGVRQVPEMAELLDRAIALQPTHRDDDNNSTLGNLHYSAAIFYRLVPDWFWIGWVLGVKGDKDRALLHSRTALALHPNRLDYQIEVGTQLLCIGSVRDESERTREGMAAMRQAIQRPSTGTDEAREIHFARIMLEDPAKSCGYSGDKMLEIDEKSARKSTR
jgi:hypothetical protein